MLSDKRLTIKYYNLGINILKKIDLKTLGIRVLLLMMLLGIAFIPIFFIFQRIDGNLWSALCSGSQQKIVTEVQKYDNQWGVLIILILQIVQDISIVIPSAPIHIAAGIVLGTWKGFLVCHLGDMLYNMAIFLFYRKIKKSVDKIVPFEDSSKTVRFIKDGRSPTYMVVMACILPAIPNGFIPYAAVNAKVKARHYFFAVLIGPAIPTLVLTLLGDIIFQGNWLLFVFLVVISFIGVFFLIKFQNQVISFFENIAKCFAKRKSVKDAEADSHEINEEDGEKEEEARETAIAEVKE